MEKPGRIFPHLDRVFLKRLPGIEKTLKGIFVPEEESRIAQVVFVGPGTRDYEMRLKVGDRVILPEEKGDVVRDGDEAYDVYKESRILGRICI